MSDVSVPPANFSVGSVLPLEEAIPLLTRAVADLSSRGTPAKAAGAKAMMRRLSMDSFDERAYGYANFRAFLRAAADRGAVLLDMASDQDYLVVLPTAHITQNAKPLPEGTPGPNGKILEAPHRTQRRVRKDLWEAFIDWRKGLIRVFDKEADRAYTFPAEPVANEPPAITELRLARAREPERYRTINPITFDEQVEWMRVFAQSLSRPEVTEILRAGFKSDHPAAIFRSTIRAFTDIDGEWRKFLLEQVTDQIYQWAERENLPINVFESPPAPKPPVAAPAPAPQKLGGDPGLTALRARLHAAIDSMPMQELMQIRLPVGYISFG